MIRVGIDAGGTFTDCVALLPGEQGVRACKLRSRPDDPATVVVEALNSLIPERLIGVDVELVFSTTASTNALLERSGGPTVLFTTAGFEDVLEIGRQARPVLYALHPVVSPPLVGAADRIGVAERVAVDGAVVTALGGAEIERIWEELSRRTGATVAVCLLHAHTNPEHERQIGERLRARGVSVSLSSEVCPLPREYERSSTTVVDAYVAPRLGATLARLVRPGLTLRVMESTGGARTIRDGQAVRPARTVLSGPAAGLVAMERLIVAHGLQAALTLDVGGTSTDVARVQASGARRVDELTIGGAVIALPSLAVDSVGAGGGSVAWLDGGGALRVGPRSAGAVPGPAAYGQDGREPTVTDAHVVLGRLGGTLAGGAVSLDERLARSVLLPLAERMNVSIDEAAQAIVDVATAAIARALRAVAASGPSFEDEAEIIVAYGGAAGLHVVEVARELGIGRVLVPPSPGLQCALGALGAPVVIEAIAACEEALDEAPGGGVSDALRQRAEALRGEVAAALVLEGGPDGATLECLARVRYEGQGLEAELELPFSPDQGLSRRAFEDAHARARGHLLEQRRRVVITRLCARGRLERAPAPTQSAHRELGWPRRGTRHGIPLYRRGRLRAGHELVGPALVEELSSTLWLPAGACGRVLSDGTIELRLEPLPLRLEPLPAET